jgi:prevent-host-death family protein
MQVWPIQNAKSKLSELVKSSQQEPQMITHHGKAVAVVISNEVFESFAHTNQSLVSFMQNSPFYDEDIEFERDASLTRELIF